MGWGEQNSIIDKPNQTLAKGGLGGPFQALPETGMGVVLSGVVMSN
jgi:hypothetical protein